MSTRDRLTLAACLAVALACSALAPLYDGTGWVPETLGVVLIVAAAGAAARRAGLPVLAVPLVQLVAVSGYVAALFAPGTWALVLPTSRTLEALQALAVQAVLDIEQLAAPVPSVPSLVLVAVAGAGLVALAVDLLAVGLQRPAVAGLPLLVLLAVPSGLLPGGLGWLPFTLGAAGWLGLLLVEGSDKVGRWGVPLRSGPSSSAGYDPDAGSTGRVGRRIGAAALGLAAFVPAVVPGLDARLLPGGAGEGDAGGPSTTVTYNPITELQGDLTLPEPREILRYTTDDPFPDYLRLTTLDTFDGAQWRSSPLSPDGDVDDGIPVPVGVTSATDSYPVRTRVSMDGGLGAQWLPLPAVPQTVDVRGPWNWNAASETVFATRSNTRRLDEYSAVSLRVQPDRALLETPTTSLPPTVEAYAVRPDVSPAVEALTREVVEGADSAYEQAVAIQGFLRDPGNGFSYEEQTQNPFDNPDALEAFLIDSRQGFCEQYASAMGAMLRVLGIPARVAVGFTPGAAQTDGVRIVTTDDAHAWPEAWFEGAGWVRFEPTPVDEDREIVPDYTEEQAADATTGAPTAGPSAAPAPSSSAAAEGKDLDQQLERGGDTPLGDPSSGTGTGTGLPSARTLALGSGAALLVAPALAALLRRRSRSRRPDPLVAWSQLQDDATDVGHRWRDADSPRAAAARLAADRDLPAPAAEALGRLAEGVEQARYARPGTLVDGDWQGEVGTVRRALLRGSSPAVRLRAVLAPPSTLRWAGSRTATLVADGLDRVDDVLGAAARRLRPRRRAAL